MYIHAVYLFAETKQREPFFFEKRRKEERKQKKAIYKVIFWMIV